MLNKDDPRREGNVVNLEYDCDVVLVGDLHGNRKGLNNAIAYADLDHHSQRRLILQEMVHGPIDVRSGQDRSVELLVRAARLKISHPEQTLFVLANHDIAQVTGNEICKDGRRVCQDFSAGVQYAFGDAAPEIEEAINEFFLSQPLAIRCPNAVMITHSLPSPTRTPPDFMTILHRPYVQDDLRRGQALYEWVWGRSHTETQLNELAKQLDVRFFLLGHRHTPGGIEIIAPNAVTIASDHEHGRIVHFNVDEPLTAENIESYVKPIAALQAP